MSSMSKVQSPWKIWVVKSSLGIGFAILNNSCRARLFPWWQENFEISTFSISKWYFSICFFRLVWAQSTKGDATCIRSKWRRTQRAKYTGAIWCCWVLGMKNILKKKKTNKIHKTNKQKTKHDSIFFCASNFFVFSKRKWAPKRSCNLANSTSSGKTNCINRKNVNR